jgi:hypothetical protein
MNVRFGIWNRRSLYKAGSLMTVSKDDEMGRARSRNEKKRNTYRLLVGKPEGKRLLGKPIRRRMDNIKIDLGEIGWRGVKCIGLDQDMDRCRAVEDAVLNHRVHKLLEGSWVYAQMAASRVELSCIELVRIVN